MARAAKRSRRWLAGRPATEGDLLMSPGWLHEACYECRVWLQPAPQQHVVPRGGTSALSAGEHRSRTSPTDLAQGSFKITAGSLLIFPPMDWEPPAPSANHGRQQRRWRQGRTQSRNSTPWNSKPVPATLVTQRWKPRGAALTPQHGTAWTFHHYRVGGARVEGMYLLGLRQN